MTESTLERTQILVFLVVPPTHRACEMIATLALLFAATECFSFVVGLTGCALLANESMAWVALTCFVKEIVKNRDITVCLFLIYYFVSKLFQLGRICMNIY